MWTWIIISIFAAVFLIIWSACRLAAKADRETAAAYEKAYREREAVTTDE